MTTKTIWFNEREWERLRERAGEWEKEMGMETQGEEGWAGRERALIRWCNLYISVIGQQIKLKTTVYPCFSHNTLVQLWRWCHHLQYCLRLSCNQCCLEMAREIGQSTPALKKKHISIFIIYLVYARSSLPTLLNPPPSAISTTKKSSERKGSDYYAKTGQGFELWLDLCSLKQIACHYKLLCSMILKT